MPFASSALPLQRAFACAAVALCAGPFALQVLAAPATTGYVFDFEVQGADPAPFECAKALLMKQGGASATWNLRLSMDDHDQVTSRGFKATFDGALGEVRADALVGQLQACGKGARSITVGLTKNQNR